MRRFIFADTLARLIRFDSAGFLDRGNIGNARVAGLTADLGMDGAYR